MSARLPCAGEGCRRTCTQTDNDGWVTVLTYLMATGDEAVHRYLCRQCARRHEGIFG